MSLFHWCLLFVVASGGTLQQGSKLPAPVEIGLQEYKTNGVTGAVQSWLRESILSSQPEVISKTVRSFQEIEQTYGSFSAYEVLGVTSLGQRTQRSYIILEYEKGPVFVYFDTYRTANHWTITGFLFNTKAEAILPARFFERTGTVR